MYLAARWRILDGMHQGQWRLGRRPALDGLRGIAVLFVVVQHLGVPIGSHSGQVGVTVFFVLSGFLITSLLLEEHQRAGAIRLGAFYLRRALRLAPALVACVAVTWGFAAFVGIPMGVGGAPAALLYVMDFVQASHDQFQSGMLAHTWSLAIEEQFYLVWPLVLIGLLRLRVRLVPALVAMGALSAGWVTWLIASGAPLARVVFAPDTRAFGLLAGCALAAAFTRWRMPGLPSWATAAALLALPVVALGPIKYGLSDPAAIMIVTGLSVVIVWGCARSSVPVLSPRWLRVLGERSYGVYLWHFPLIGFVVYAVPSITWFGLAVVVLPMTAAFVEASWRWIEQPALRLKDRVRRADGAPAQVPSRWIEA